MRIHASFYSLLGSAVLLAVTSACATRANYLEVREPRFAADHTSGLSARAETFKIVSYNIRYGKELEAAIELLTQVPELADADVYLLQEMSAYGVDRIAVALDCAYVYYPASLRTSGRDFGNAVLTRHGIVADEKIRLPHLNPFNRQQRIAVRTDVELDGRPLLAYSVHTETPFLRLRDRVEQVETLLACVPEGPRPCLIAGDFNTLSRRSLGDFERAFAGRGFRNVTEDLGSTFSLGPFGYAADHIFVRDLELVRAGKVDGAEASDHLPIWAEFSWAQAAR